MGGCERVAPRYSAHTGRLCTCEWEKGCILVNHRSGKTSRHSMPSVRPDRPFCCRKSFADRSGVVVLVRPHCRSTVVVLRSGR